MAISLSALPCTGLDATAAMVEASISLADIRRGARTLSQREAVALAGEVYKAFAETLEDNPGDPKTWTGTLAANEAARRGEFGLASLVIGEDAKRAIARSASRTGTCIPRAISIA